MMETKKCFGSRKDRYFYRCDGCEVITESLTAECLLEVAYPGWLKFQDGRTFCPACLAKRLKPRTATWPAFYRAENELSKETGINANEGRPVLYRLWQLRGVFPEAYVANDGSDYVIIQTASWAYSMITIYNDGKMTFTNFRNACCKFG